MLFIFIQQTILLYRSIDYTLTGIVMASDDMETHYAGYVEE